jgi:hypothetical protein
VAEDRIGKLSERFQRHAVGRKPSASQRERRSFYLDGQLVERLDQVYRDVVHDLHPQRVSKSAFLEGLLEFGLAHLPEVKALLHDEDQI